MTFNVFLSCLTRFLEHCPNCGDAGNSVTPGRMLIEILHVLRFSLKLQYVQKYDKITTSVDSYSICNVGRQTIVKYNYEQIGTIITDGETENVFQHLVKSR